MTLSLYPHLTQRVNVEGGDEGVHAAVGGAVSLQRHAGNGPRLLCTQCVNREMRKLVDPHEQRLTAKFLLYFIQRSDKSAVRYLNLNLDHIFIYFLKLKGKTVGGFEVGFKPLLQIFFFIYKLFSQ